MMSARPICVHCGKQYGQRALEDQIVRWDTPTKDIPTGRKLDEMVKVAIEPTVPPPPYRGNGMVAKETKPYLSADNNRMVMHRSVWDGVSWRGGYTPFCTLRCALDFARSAHKAGYRP
jgi:hypothetical protein